MITRRSLALGSVVALASARFEDAKAELSAGHAALDKMMATLQGQSAFSFATALEYGSNGKTDLKLLGPVCRVLFARGDGLLANYGGDLQLLVKSGRASLYRRSKNMKVVLKAAAGSSPFAVPGLFLPFLCLTAEDVRPSMFGSISSISVLDEGLPLQPEKTILVAVQSSLFTGEIWVKKSRPVPARIVGTFFDSTKLVSQSVRIDFSNWSVGSAVSQKLHIPGLSGARDVPLSALGL